MAVKGNPKRIFCQGVKWQDLEKASFLQNGLSWSISKNLFCDISISHGLTEDSPDFVLEVRLPYTF